MLALVTAGVAGAAGGTATPLFRFADPAVTESSGLAVSSYDDRVVFTHNDSGDVARFFAVDAGTGATLTTYRLPGATNVDWEDMAAAPDESGRPSLWLADIGDNRGRRAQVTVYRVPEPRVDRGGRSGAATTAPPLRLRLRFPDGPRDAEALLVDSHRGGLYVVTKSFSGRAEVYAAPLPLRSPAGLGLVATVELGLGAAVTGGALAPAGDRLVLRTYADAYGWPLDSGGVPAALRRSPQRVELPAAPQGESVAFGSNGTLLVGSEGLHSAVYGVRLSVSERTATPGRATGVRPSTREPRTRQPAGRMLLFAVLMVGLGSWMVRRRHVRRRHVRRPTS